MEPLTELSGARVRAVAAAPGDAGALQAVMDAARDYFVLTEGAPAPAGAARALLDDAEADDQRRVYLVWAPPPPGRATRPSTPPPLRAAAARSATGQPSTALIGFLDLHLHQPEPGVAHVGVLALRPEARGRGVGSALVEALAAALRAEGFTALRASVGDENPAARGFWEAAGFAEVGRLEGGVTVLERALC